MKICFIGAGKVGFSLGKFFVENGVQVTGYYNRHRESAEEAASFTGTICYDSIEDIIKDSDAIFLTVPDDSITEVFETVKNYNINNKQICHCSGAMSARDAFPGIEETGASGYSIHPLFPVSDKLNSYRELGDAFFCIEGTGKELSEWEKMLSGISAGVQVIDGGAKAEYHAACVISSNLMCALFDESIRHLTNCGFSEETARRAITPLTRSNLEHLIDKGAVNALTGPVERCDVSTVSKHLAVTDNDPLYIAASLKLILIAEKKNPSRDYGEMKKLLEDGRRKGAK